MGVNSMTAMDKPELYGIFVKYGRPKTKIEEEYTLMGANAIISAAGGSLGLFLGFSCYGAIWNIFESAETVFSHIILFFRKKSGNGRIRMPN